MNNFLSSISVAVMCFLLLGCDGAKEENIPGIYRAEYIGNIDELVILSDMTYVHSFIGDNGGLVSRKGNWSIEILNNESLGITFEDFSFRQGAYELKPAGYWHVEVEKTVFGLIQLCFDPDMDKCFIKRVR